MFACTSLTSVVNCAKCQTASLPLAKYGSAFITLQKQKNQKNQTLSLMARGVWIICCVWKLGNWNSLHFFLLFAYNCLISVNKFVSIVLCILALVNCLLLIIEHPAYFVACGLSGCENIFEKKSELIANAFNFPIKGYIIDST